MDRVGVGNLDDGEGHYISQSLQRATMHIVKKASTSIAIIHYLISNTFICLYVNLMKCKYIDKKDYSTGHYATTID